MTKPKSTDYAPYDQLPAFKVGFDAYGVTWTNPFPDGVNAQAWERGLEFASRLWRWRDQNVGAC